jgi:hypothetical protein
VRIRYNLCLGSLMVRDSLENIIWDFWGFVLIRLSFCQGLQLERLLQIFPLCFPGSCTASRSGSNGMYWLKIAGGIFAVENLLQFVLEGSLVVWAFWENLFGMFGECGPNSVKDVLAPANIGSRICVCLR